MTWTKQMDDKLMSMKKTGYSFAEISVAIGKSRSAAIGRYNRINGKATQYQKTKRAKNANLPAFHLTQRHCEWINENQSKKKGTAPTQAELAVLFNKKFGTSLTKDGFIKAYYKSRAAGLINSVYKLKYKRQISNIKPTQFAKSGCHVCGKESEGRFCEDHALEAFKSEQGANSRHSDTYIARYC